MPQFKAEVKFDAIVSIKEGVDPVAFIKNDNDYIGEPKNGNGVIISLKPAGVTIIELKRKSEPVSLQDTSENKLDRFMHFSYRGAIFCVDTVERTVTSTSKARPVEMIGPKVCGLWPMNVEISN